MPEENGQIRAAEPADVSAIQALICELAEYEKLRHAVVATEASLQRNLFGDRPAAEAIVALDAGQVVGFALFFTTYSTFVGKPGIYLEDVYVRPKARGKGFGRALLQYVARTAVERDCGRVEWSVLNWNEPAIRFYQSLGAEPLEEWTMYRLTDEALARTAAD